MTLINFRKAQEGDFEKIAALQNQNLFSALDEDEKKDGLKSAWKVSNVGEKCQV